MSPCQSSVDRPLPRAGQRRLLSEWNAERGLPATSARYQQTRLKPSRAVSSRSPRTPTPKSGRHYRLNGAYCSSCHKGRREKPITRVATNATGQGRRPTRLKSAASADRLDTARWKLNSACQCRDGFWEENEREGCDCDAEDDCDEDDDSSSSCREDDRLRFLLRKGDVSAAASLLLNDAAIRLTGHHGDDRDMSKRPTDRGYSKDG